MKRLAEELEGSTVVIVRLVRDCQQRVPTALTFVPGWGLVM